MISVKGKRWSLRWRSPIPPLPRDEELLFHNVMTGNTNAGTVEQDGGRKKVVLYTKQLHRKRLKKDNRRFNRRRSNLRGCWQGNRKNKVLSIYRALLTLKEK